MERGGTKKERETEKDSPVDNPAGKYAGKMAQKRGTTNYTQLDHELNLREIIGQSICVKRSVWHIVIELYNPILQYML